jgi:hypothetical protein
MKQRHRQVGFSQRVRLEWLERTANLVLAGNTEQDTIAGLQAFLHDKISVGGSAVRSNREKVITILRRVWLPAADELAGLRDAGLGFLRDLPQEEHLAVHWGMVMAAYPFWTTVAETVGRLLRLQGTVSAAQAQRRIRESFGERETVARAARRVVRALVDWSVLVETDDKGTYRPGVVTDVPSTSVAAWLVAAYLHSSPTGKANLNVVLNSPAFFPLRLPVLTAHQVSSATSERVEVVRHAMNEDLVMLVSRLRSDERMGG